MPTPADTRLLLLAQAQGLLSEVEVARCLDALGRAEQAGRPLGIRQMLMSTRLLDRAQIERLAAEALAEARAQRAPGSGRWSPAELGLPTQSAQLGVGSRVAGILLKREIARDGMGALFEGWEGSRQVAVQVLSAEAAAQGAVVESFKQEARLAVSLNHPNLIKLQATGSEAGIHYLVMDYFDGRSLASLIRPGRLTPKKALSVMATVAGACDHMHQHGVAHRDVKPATILVGKGGAVCLTSFGLAKDAARSDPTLTAAGFGRLLGTPAYMAPEQAMIQLDRIGPWTDVYALGAVIFRALSGRFPFPETGYLRQVQAISQGNPPRLRSVRPDAPAELDQIVSAAMAFEPADRPTAAQLANQLDRLLDRGHILMPPGPPGDEV